MAGVTISGLSIGSGLGTLLYGTTAVANNQFISAADIAAGMLSFAPADDVYSGTGSFSFKVKDATGQSDATARVMSLAFDGADRSDTTLDTGYWSSASVPENAGIMSFKDTGYSPDSLTLSGSPVYSGLTFLKSGNNLEIEWTSGGGAGHVTLLDHYVYTNDDVNNSFESINIGGNYGQFGLPATYVPSLTFTNDSVGGRVIVAGTNGNDALSGGAYGDLMFGNGGADTLNGNGNSDLLAGGLGNDTLRGGLGNDTYLFGLTDGNDVIFDEGGNPDRIVIKANGATLSGLSAYDTVDGGASGDLMILYNGQSIDVEAQYGGGGNAINTINFDGATVYGYALGSGDFTFDVNDPVTSSRTIDRSSTSSNNFLAGELGRVNVLTGGSGKDLIFGGNLDDTLAGSNGDNLIIGGKGNDTLGAGNGNDVYVFGLADGTDTITDGTGTDRIFIDSSGVSLSGLSAYDDNPGTAAGNLVIGYNGQQITVSNHFTGAGSGAIETIEFDGGSVYGYDLRTGAYNISKSDLADNVGALRVVDLSASSADNLVAGELGTANAMAGGSGRDLLFGGDLIDALRGGGGDDLLVGGAGDDRLAGGAGNDTLVGGAGADHFRFNAATDGLDSILDFSGGEGDLIEILGSAFGGLSVGSVDTAAFEKVGGNVDASAKTFVFDASTDTLYWNADGAGGQAAVALAHLENGHDVTAADLRIV
jgi:Ca2+-binding RTX toxin-like protein